MIADGLAYLSIGYLKYEVSIPNFGTGISTLGLAVSDLVSASVYRYRGFISQFRIIKNVVLYPNQDFVPSTTLSPQTQTNAKKLVDSGNSLILGNFIGQLDEVTIFDGSPSNSMIRFLKDDATQYTYSLPVAASVFDDQSYARCPVSSQYWGNGKIWGTVTNAEGTPMSRKIVLIEYWSFVPILETISDPTTGYYEFLNLDTDAIFSVVAEDYLDYRYNDIIRAKVRAEVV